MDRPPLKSVRLLDRLHERLRYAHYSFRPRRHTSTGCASSLLKEANYLESKTIKHFSGCEGFPRQEILTKLEEDLEKMFKTRRFMEARFRG
jgi:hypothetical protein